MGSGRARAWWGGVAAVGAVGVFAAGCVTAEPGATVVPVAKLLQAAPAPPPSSAPAPERKAAPGDAPLLEHEGQVVHPLCVHALVGGEGKGAVALATCAAEQDGSKAAPPTLAERVVSHMGSDAGDGWMNVPFFEYEVVGEVRDLYVVRYLWNGGGTGYFSGVSVLRKIDAQLALVRGLTGGDRCNGGVESVSMERGAVRVGVSATPADLFELTASGKGLGLVAYQDLEASAMSCFATVTRTFELATGEAKLAEVSLGEPQDDPSGWPGYTHQACFTQVFNAAVDRALTPTELDAFIADFAKKCLPPAAQRHSAMKRDGAPLPSLDRVRAREGGRGEGWAGRIGR